MSRYLAPSGLALRHWPDEATAVVRLQGAGTTHLIGSDGLAVLQAVAAHPGGLQLREIAHALGIDGETDRGLRAGLQRIIDGLLQSGLLCRADEDADPGREGPR